MSETLRQQLDAAGRTERQRHSAARAAALEQYWRIIGRQDAPEDGDGTRIREFAEACGRTPGDVRADIEAFARIVRVRARAAQLAQLERARMEAVRAHEKAAGALGEQIQSLRDRVGLLQQQRRAAESRWSKAREAAKVLLDLIDRLVARGMPRQLAGAADVSEK